MYPTDYAAAVNDEIRGIARDDVLLDDCRAQVDHLGILCFRRHPSWLQEGEREVKGILVDPDAPNELELGWTILSAALLLPIKDADERRLHPFRGVLLRKSAQCRIAHPAG